MKYLLFFPFLAFVTSCSSLKPSDQKNLTVSEAWNSESGELSEFSLTTDDQKLSFSVVAKNLPTVIPPVNKNGHYFTAVDIGSLAPVECLIYPTDIPPASALKMVTDDVLKSPQVGKVVEKRTSFLTAGALEGHPFLMQQTSFRSESKRGVLTGNLKAIIGTKEIGNLICVHNEVGYQKTFVNVFRSILKSMDFLKLPKVDVKYKSIMILSLKAFPIGYIVEYVGENQLQLNSWVEKTSVMIPMSNDKVAALDNLTVELSDEKGKLSYGLYKSDEDGKPDHLINLTTKNFLDYQVEGIKGEEKVAQGLKAPHGLYSNFEITRMIRKKFFQEKQKSFSLAGFAPEQSMTQPTTLKLKLQKYNKGGALITFSDGKLTHHAVVERDGTEEAVTFNLNEVKIQGKRVFKEGLYPGN